MTEERHIFVFRHCLRSTPSAVTLYDNNFHQYSINDPMPISDIWEAPLPTWNVPSEWCTPQGIRILERTATWLATELLMDKATTTNNSTSRTLPSTMTVRLLSDTSQRDFDSGVAVRGALQTLGMDVNIIELDPQLFHTTSSSDKDEYDELYANTNCTSSNLINASTLAFEIQTRLEAIHPPFNLHEALLFMDTLVHFKPEYKQQFLKSSSSKILFNNRKMHIQGPVNLISLMAQMMLYSRASLINDFLPNATVADIATLVPWIAWRRTIEHAFHSSAAQQGVTLINFILKELEKDPINEPNPNPSNDGNTNNTHGNSTTKTVIFLFGHDSTLNALQTVLNVEWSLPFYGPNSPTPPSSVMHFYQKKERTFTSSPTLDCRFHDKENDCILDESISIDLLYPTYFDTTTEPIHDPANNPNTSGILERYRLQVFPNTMELRKHVAQQLAQYDPVLEQCFESIHSNGVTPSTNNNTGLSPASHYWFQTSMDWVGSGPILALVLILVVILSFQALLHCWMPQRHSCSLYHHHHHHHRWVPSGKTRYMKAKNPNVNVAPV